MANIKISELPELTSLADNDELPIVDKSTTLTKRVTKANLKAAVNPVSGTGVGEVQYMQGADMAGDLDLIWHEASKSLAIGQPTILPDNPLAIAADVDSYAQLNIQNINPGTLASTDIVATANNGTDSMHYIDMGIGSSTYSSDDYPTLDANDAYIYSPDDTIRIQTDGSGKKINFEIEQVEKVKVDSDGLTVSDGRLNINTDYTATGSEVTGSIYWDTTNHTASMVLENGVILQIGQEGHLYAKNTSGSIIHNGDACSVTSAGGSFTTIGLTDPTDTTSATAFIGLATHDIAVNDFGYVTLYGVVRDINTNSFTEGLPVYVDPSSAGHLTQTFPSAPNYIINVGIVEYKHSQQGRINVVKAVVPKLQDLSDVDGTALTTTGQILVWNNSTKYWDPSDNITNYGKLSSNQQWTGTNKFGSGSNYTQIDSNGHMTFAGDATYFDDLPNDALKLKVTGVGIIEDLDENAINFQSSANLSDYCIGNYQMSHKRKDGTKIYPHIHFEQTTSAIPNFLIRYRWQENGATKTTSWSDYKCNTLAFTYTSGTLNQIAYGAGITPSSDSISDVIELRIFRDNANTSTVFSGTDTAPANVLVTSIDIHYEADSLGSNTEYSK